MTVKEYWNDAFKSGSGERPRYDNWLDKHQEILEKSKNRPILDLGCGSGGDSLYLTERGYQVVCCDISEEAVARVKKYIPEARCLAADMREGLPFDDGSFNVVIADLSLHYFRWEDTLRIIRDIGRILSAGGVLLCRVNSTNDVNYGAGQGTPIEENYYLVNGNTKRFFDRGQIESLFNDWEIRYIRECQMDRYGLPKLLWEITVHKH